MVHDRVCGVCHRERGVVLVITLLALLLIGALVFYVFNIGHAVQQRVAAQNAADATAISGAGWVARSMNIASMDNVEMARLIAYVDVLDATEEALQPAYAQSSTLHDALVAQEPNGDGEITGAEAVFLRQQMQPIVRQYVHDLKVLGPLKRLFKAPTAPAQYATPSGSLDVRSYTFVHGPSGQGKLWKAIVSLQGFSEAAMGSLGTLSRVAAIHLGQADMENGGGVIFLPGRVTVPWHLGTWSDFKRPVSMGRLPSAIDDKQVNRGPWDTIFGWHEQAFKWKIVRQGVWHTKGSSPASGPSGPGGLGPAQHSSGYWDPRPLRWKIADGYQVYGPQAWMLQKLRYGKLKQSPFYQWRDLFAQWKLGYAFDGTPTQMFRKPVWLTGWSQIEGAAKGGQIKSTCLFVTRVESDVSADSGSYLSPGTYTMQTPGKIVQWPGNWSVSSDPCDRSTNDPRAWEAKLKLWRKKCPGFKKLSKQRQAQWKAAKYVQLGAQTWRFGSPMVRDGKKVWQYMYYVVLGVDVGTRVPVRNPFNFRNGQKRPAPIELDQRQAGARNLAGRAKYFTYLGVAEDAGVSPMWPSRFDADRVFAHGVAIAQAQVFNNHSWDLWTQMWHARLEPVADYAHWASLAASAPAGSWAGSGLSSAQAAALGGYLQRIQPLAPVMLNH